MTRYRLEMNEKQARMVIDALDFWMRMRIGQWEELTDLCLEPTQDMIEKYCENREAANEKLFEARQIVMPELTKNASWGVYKFPETERAFNVKCGASYTIKKRSASGRKKPRRTAQLLTHTRKKPRKDISAMENYR